MLYQDILCAFHNLVEARVLASIQAGYIYHSVTYFEATNHNRIALYIGMFDNFAYRIKLNIDKVIYFMPFIIQ